MARSVAERADVLPVLGELFRAHGFEGASLAVIAKATGLGKGSLYNFFPGGKEEMAAAVLANVEEWFESNLFAPLSDAPDGVAAIAAMFTAVDGYFRSGRRMCLVGVFALGDIRDPFGARIQGYFQRWIDSLAAALVRAGQDAGEARGVAEEVVAGIQGGLVMARATDDPALFGRVLDRLRRRCGLAE